MSSRTSWMWSPQARLSLRASRADCRYSPATGSLGRGARATSRSPLGSLQGSSLRNWAKATKLDSDEAPVFKKTDFLFERAFKVNDSGQLVLFGRRGIAPCTKSRVYESHLRGILGKGAAIESPRKLAIRRWRWSVMRSFRRHMREGTKKRARIDWAKGQATLLEWPRDPRDNEVEHQHDMKRAAYRLGEKERYKCKEKKNRSSFGIVFVDRYVEREAQCPVSILLKHLPSEIHFITPARPRTLDLLGSIYPLLLSIVSPTWIYIQITFHAISSVMLCHGDTLIWENVSTVVPSFHSVVQVM